MVNHTVCTVIGYIFAIFHGISILAVTYNLIDSIKTSEGVTASSYVGLTVSLITSIVVCAASVFLILGIKNKRHQQVAPWVYLVGVSVVLGIFRLIWVRAYFVQALVGVALMIALWYPIFALYRELRSGNIRNQQPEHHPLNVGGAGSVYPPTVVVQGSGYVDTPPQNGSAAGFVAPQGSSSAPPTQEKGYPQAQPVYPELSRTEKDNPPTYYTATHEKQ